MPAACHRANEYVGVDEMLGETYAIAEQRAVRKRRTRVHRNHADGFPERTCLAHECRRERRLSDARRSREADRQRPARTRVERANQLGTAAAFSPRNGARECPGFTFVEIAQQGAGGIVLWQSLSWIAAGAPAYLP